MDDAERGSDDGDELRGIDPDARAYYRDSPTGNDGMAGAVRETIDRLVPGSNDTPPDRGRASTQSGETPPGTTDYVTSNYAEDTGHPPAPADMDDVTQDYREETT